jgi:hypothetical protein
MVTLTIIGYNMDIFHVERNKATTLIEPGWTYIGY